MSDKKIKPNQRLSRKQKEAHDFQWYKDQANLLDNEHGELRSVTEGVSEYKRMKVNYDLYNNILNLADFEYVCQPYGAEMGELPARMVNRDISSPKIKSILGMEMKRPFSWKVIATNPEATTQREQKEFGMIKSWVTQQIMQPVVEEIELEYQQQLKGKDLGEEEKAKIRKQISQEIKARTPKEVKKYMSREYQTPAEMMSSQLLQYLIKRCKLERKFNDAFKHLNLSAKEILYVGEVAGHPEVFNINSLRFNYGASPESPFIQDGEYASYEYRLTPSQVVEYFGDELTNKEIDDIYSDISYYKRQSISDDLFSGREFEDDEANTVRVLHCVWKSLTEVNFLTYEDLSTGEIREMVVGESYELNEEAGDIKLEAEWIPETYETWKIGDSIYKKMRPIPGQFKDVNDLYNCKLPYYGVVCDNMNSAPTAIMDRLKPYQYYFNIIMYRMETMLASDKGKKLLMNIKNIPKSSGIDTKTWLYYFDSIGIGWFDPDEEGSGYQDVNSAAKSIDMSLASDIAKYVELAEYIRTQAGEAVGITKQVEGQIGQYEAVNNVNQVLTQSSHILEPYFELHNQVKAGVLEALIETAKVCYTRNGIDKLTYVLDDSSIKTITLDLGLLNNSTLGIFVANSAKADMIKETITQLAHAALQNQRVELSDVIKVVKENSISGAEEVLKLSEQERKEYEQNLQDRKLQADAEEKERERMREREKEDHEEEMIILKGEIDKEREIIKASLLAASYNPDKDDDNDGIPDFIELARDGLDADIKKRKQQLDRDKFEHQKGVDKEKLKIEKKKLQNKSSGK